MGDRGGKKDKNKSQKQKEHQHEQKEIKRQDKQHKDIPITNNGKSK
jgi:hypothetical protein